MNHPPLTKTNKIVVGISDMKISARPCDMLKTYALGTCVGISAYDPVNRIGGLLHFQLPYSRSNRKKAKSNPNMFGDTGIAELFNALFEKGAAKKNLKVTLAGGACISGSNNTSNLGKRNLLIAKKILWKNGIVIDAGDVGGSSWRNMSLDIGSGKLTIRTVDGEYDLVKAIA